MNLENPTSFIPQELQSSPWIQRLVTLIQEQTKLIQEQTEEIVALKKTVQEQRDEINRLKKREFWISERLKASSQARRLFSLSPIQSCLNSIKP